ncbi:hypothetical protein [Aliiglaciecola sp. LCG003]|uniref:hypothetical protein n=1 Tax=Aliiglaciecola sp. LCG003 TaxID=3053655 RepID=UPI0025737D69|nr:hypothetical protein [Aliiglaciecola sp. LCG003]WJG08955.1 hypothetical protein QR722_16730 [Aliiglaciecola sp. LCG003]
MKQVIFICFVFVSTNVYATVSAEISFCNTCTSTAQFESRALYSGEGEHLIINLEEGIAKHFRVKYEQSELLAVSLSLPVGFEEDLLKIIEIKQAFDQRQGDDIPPQKSNQL